MCGFLGVSPDLVDVGTTNLLVDAMSEMRDKSLEKNKKVEGN